jgi:hypothetical protein
MPKKAKRRSTERLVKAAKEHRRTIDRVLDKQILLPVRDAYEEASASLGRALRRGFQGRLREAAAGRTTFEQIGGVIGQKSREIASRVVIEMEHAARGTLAESAQALAKFAGRMDPRANPLDDDVVMARVINAQKRALAEMREDASKRLAEGLNAALQRRLTKETGEGTTLGQTITGLSEEMDNQWWQVERFVRTETSNAYNKAHAAGIAALSEEDPSVYMRWTEHVDDLTGEPKDNRVGQDSLVLHGQVARPGKLFHMPNDPRAPKAMIGKTWQHPPNRPNDRSILLPWKPGWGIPAWEFRNGKRVRLGA